MDLSLRGPNESLGNNGCVFHSFFRKVLLGFFANISGIILDLPTYVVIFLKAEGVLKLPYQTKSLRKSKEKFT